MSWCYVDLPLAAFRRDSVNLWHRASR